jgi:methylated-DNA-[protein]-cysteine S-methyltransferase
METTTFHTALGRFGIGWTETGLARVLLPGSDEAALIDRLNRGDARPGEPTRAIAALMDRIEDYAEGERVEFADVRLDLRGVPDFHRRAYELLLGVGWGETLTYGDLARRLGDVGLSRAVGQAMGANPMPLVIPCHRVLASDGKPGGFSAPGGAASKVKMLALEGVSVGAPAGQMSFGF